MSNRPVRCFLCFLCFPCLLVDLALGPTLGFCGFAVAAESTPGTPIGVAKVDITPEYPVRMYGYGDRTTESQGVAGWLKAAALAIGGDGGEGPAVLLSVDSGAVPADIRAEVLRRVRTKTPVKPERFVLCNAHSHSGPNLKDLAAFVGTEREHLVRYRKELTDNLERAVLQALKSRGPGRLAWGQGSAGFATSRRVLKDGTWVRFGAVPDAPADRAVPILRAVDTEGKLIAVVANYACHNTTLRDDFKQIHGDWAACAAEFIEADNPGAVAMITIGCGADADPSPHGTVELCRRHGRAMADEVKRLLAGPLKPVAAEITARVKTVRIPYEPPLPVDEVRKLRIKDFPGAPADRWVKRLERGEKPPAAESYEFSVWTFGNDLAMVFLSQEVVADYSLRLRRELDGSRLWINAYSNDVSYYVVSDRLISEGGYEPHYSLSATLGCGRADRVQPSMEQRIVEAVRSLLPEGFRK